MAGYDPVGSFMRGMEGMDAHFQKEKDRKRADQEFEMQQQLFEQQQQDRADAEIRERNIRSTRFLANRLRDKDGNIDLSKASELTQDPAMREQIGGILSEAAGRPIRFDGIAKGPNGEAVPVGSVDGGESGALPKEFTRLDDADAEALTVSPDELPALLQSAMAEFTPKIQQEILTRNKLIQNEEDINEIFNLRAEGEQAGSGASTSTKRTPSDRRGSGSTSSNTDGISSALSKPTTPNKVEGETANTDVTPKVSREPGDQYPDSELDRYGNKLPVGRNPSRDYRRNRLKEDSVDAAREALQKDMREAARNNNPEEVQRLQVLLDKQRKGEPLNDGGSSSKTAPRKPRGQRNNNPLNIEKSSNAWQGKVEGNDERYETFESPEHGYRAAYKTLQTYQDKHGLKSTREVVNRWAPPNENDTESYVQAVAEKTGQDPDEPIDLSDPETATKFMDAMTQVELGGQPYDTSTIRKGVEMGGGSSPTPRQGTLDRPRKRKEVREETEQSINDESATKAGLTGDKRKKLTRKISRLVANGTLTMTQAEKIYKDSLGKREYGGTTKTNTDILILDKNGEVMAKHPLGISEKTKREWRKETNEAAEKRIEEGYEDRDQALDDLVDFFGDDIEDEPRFRQRTQNMIDRTGMDVRKPHAIPAIIQAEKDVEAWSENEPWFGESRSERFVTDSTPFLFARQLIGDDEGARELGSVMDYARDNFYDPVRRKMEEHDIQWSDQVMSNITAGSMESVTQHGYSAKQVASTLKQLVDEYPEKMANASPAGIRKALRISFGVE